MWLIEFWKFKFEFSTFVKLLLKFNFSDKIKLIKVKLNSNTPFFKITGKNSYVKIWVVKILYHFVPAFFHLNLKLCHQKIGFCTGHQDIGQKI